jgi:hypothetical protein
MKYGNVDGENMCFMTANPPLTHTLRSAHPEQRLELNPKDVSKNSKSTIDREHKDMTYNSYLISVVLSMS